MRIRIVRRTSFSAAVRYHGEAYGELSRLKGLGFNYRLDAHIEGEIDPLTGMIVNLSDIDRWLKELVDPLDHQVLNEVPAFDGVIPTAERIAIHCAHELAEKVKSSAGQAARLVKLRLYEGDGFWVDVFL